jgi:ectoine hydroxylase-related dioxygenase (phytanoyl-CoA dioxygenase family)
MHCTVLFLLAAEAYSFGRENAIGPKVLRVRGGAVAAPVVCRFDAHSVTATPAATIDALNKDGVVCINQVLQPATAERLLDHVNKALEVALQGLQDGFEGVTSTAFGQVLNRVNRHDLKLALSPAPVQAAMEELLDGVRPILASLLDGEANAELYELAALVSDPNAPGQPIHPDTPHRDDQGIAVLTAFVALQDIGPEMGPTLFVPGTHTAEAHAAFNTADDDGAAKLGLLRSRPSWRACVDVGTCYLFDSRVLHCGCANESPNRRVVFYASFRAKDAVAPPGTLLYELRGRHRLDLT